MSASLAGLHERYRLQASWTASIRDRLLSWIDPDRPSRILEVGSGTGVITGELARRTHGGVFGVDLDPHATTFASTKDEACSFAAADGAKLPFQAGQFDACVCHFLLLWVTDPAAVLSEMVRVTRSRGHVMAFAEPDYGGRIDHPAELSKLGILQARALESQGADPSIGRRLRGLFSDAGLVDVHSGVLGGEWPADETQQAVDSEWEMIRQDLPSLAPAQIAAYRRLDEQARRSGKRILYVPTFYAAGRVA
jgi:SAM-dependent methyltransferase